MNFTSGDVQIIERNIDITDRQFYSMVENQVRTKYARCEENTLLPLVENIYKLNKIEDVKLIDFPVEGYYYKTPKLRRYFQLVRNLQENPEIYSEIKDSNEVSELTWLLNSTVWGTKKSERTEGRFPRMRDILSITLDELKFAENWKIDIILKKLPEFATGNANLVELGYLTGDIACLTASAETNALYRDFSMCLFSGCGSFNVKYVDIYHWKVKPEVDEMGKRLVEKYNEILNHFEKSANLLIHPNINNHIGFDKSLESPRVAMLGRNMDTGTYYHWIMETGGNVREEWSTGVITTEGYKNGKESMPFQLFDFSGLKQEDGSFLINGIKREEIK